MLHGRWIEAPAPNVPPAGGLDERLSHRPVATRRSISDSDVEGLIQIRAEGEGVRLTGKVTGLSPGKHGFHVHQYGDLSDPTGKSAGSHFNPNDQRHGGPSDEEHHAGDLGNIEANEQGEATVDVAAPWLKLHFILGRGMVVHGGEDDLTSQPSGDAGDRVAVGVIGIGNPDASGR